MNKRGRVENDEKPPKLVFGEWRVCPTCRAYKKKIKNCGVCHGSGVVQL